MAKTFQLGRPDLADEVARRLACGGSRREMERLNALRLGLGGEHTLEQIAQAVGRARSRVIEWMRIARQEGVEALLGRHQGRGRQAQVRGAVLKGLRQGLRRGRWKRAKDAGLWLVQRHGISLSEAGVRYWLKKAGES
jgi:transposase